MRHIKLVEARPLAVGFRYLLNGRAARCAEAVGEVEFFGYGGDGQLAERMVYFVDADWSESEGSGDWDDLSW